MDFDHVKKFGAPITFDTYFKLEHGPIPTVIMNLVNEAEDDTENSILADTIDIQKNSNSEIHRIISRRSLTKQDLSMLSKNEIEILERVCTRFSKSNTKQIEESSHVEAPWNNTKMFSKILYSLAAKDPDSLVSKEDIEMNMKIYSYGR
jgi:uncharacterized phage-associated protein